MSPLQCASGMRWTARAVASPRARAAFEVASRFFQTLFSSFPALRALLRVLLPLRRGLFRVWLLLPREQFRVLRCFAQAATQKADYSDGQRRRYAAYCGNLSDGHSITSKYLTATQLEMSVKRASLTPPFVWILPTICCLFSCAPGTMEPRAAVSPP